jgi:hypothetical protein
MKRIHTISLAVGILLLAFQATSWAQTITLDSVSGTHFCPGDPFSVTFTTTGTWGHNNAFTLQLSNDSGTFDNGFQNLGSIKDTAAGTYSIITSAPTNVVWVQPSIQTIITQHDSLIGADSIIVRDTVYDTIQASRYRVRIIGAIPYVESANNGSDITIGEEAEHVVWAAGKPGGQAAIAAAVGVPIALYFGQKSTLYWQDTKEYIDFGKDATPQYDTTFEDVWPSLPEGISVAYNSSGLKTIFIETVAPGGCSVLDSFQVYAFGCDNPVIPHDAIILASDTVFTAENPQLNKTFWLNPGVSVAGLSGSDTIFAEAGSSVSGPQDGDIVYLKKGASSGINDEGVVVYQPGASVVTKNGNGTPYGTIECSDLTFDYSVAPPNSIMHINDNEAVAPEVPKAQIEVSPNPTSSMITLSGLSSNASVAVMNVLGEMVEEQKASTTTTLDLSKLARGTYYIRIASNGSVTTKKIVKE